MKVGRFEVSDVAPLSPYNKGFLEGATWQEGLTNAAAERRVRILELKLVIARCSIPLGGASWEMEKDATLALEAMDLTPEEEAL